jgi:hypothetical protein
LLTASSYWPFLNAATPLLIWSRDFNLSQPVDVPSNTSSATETDIRAVNFMAR